MQTSELGNESSSIPVKQPDRNSSGQQDLEHIAARFTLHVRLAVKASCGDGASHGLYEELTEPHGAIKDPRLHNCLVPDRGNIEEEIDLPWYPPTDAMLEEGQRKLKVLFNLPL